MPFNSARLRRQSIFGLAAVAVAAAILLPWWRNHALLRDFYDYGNIVAAAGRIQLGEKPYVDFLTPLQTLEFYAAVGAERLFGPSYLSLTYANAVVILASLAGMTALLARPLGRWTALMVAAGVVGSSSLQHTIVWYNALGVAWVAAVVWPLAQLPWRGRARVAYAILVLAVLWFGGMTKLTYQVAALAFAVLFIVRAAWRKKISTSHAVIGLVACLLFGIALPLGTELLVTGATFATWKHNVLELASSRTGLLRAITSVGFYRQTPHDYYAPMYFPFVGAWGVGLLVLATVAIGWRLSRQRERPIAEFLFLAIAAAGAAACGVVLLATNFDIAYLSGAAWLVLIAGVVLAFPAAENGVAGRGLRWLLVLASLSVLLPAWVSAWQGSRALWGSGPLVRTELVSADDLPSRYAYLKGMRITAPWHVSLQGFDEYQRGLAEQGVPASAMYFANGTEWMVRAFPEARRGGLPLWLHDGTTYSAATVQSLIGRLERGMDVQVVISDERWDRWSGGMDQFIHDRFISARVGGQLHAYRLRPELSELLAHPLEFAALTGSNLFAGGMTTTAGPLSFHLRDGGGYLSGSASYRIDFDFGVPDVSGDMVAELLQPENGRAVTAIFRVVEKKQDGDEAILTEEKVTLTSQQPTSARHFAVNAHGGNIAFDVVLPPGAEAAAGWRKLRTSGSANGAAPEPGPLDRSLPRAVVQPAWLAALFSGGKPPTGQMEAFSIDVHDELHVTGRELFTHAPGEIWLKVDGPATRLSGNFGLREAAWTHADSLVGVRVSVVYYKAGRFELLDQRELRPRHEADRVAQSFDVRLPDTGGSVGLLITTLEGHANAYGHLWWRNFRLQ